MHNNVERKYAINKVPLFKGFLILKQKEVVLNNIFHSNIYIKVIITVKMENIIFFIFSYLTSSN